MRNWQYLKGEDYVNESPMGMYGGGGGGSQHIPKKLEYRINEPSYEQPITLDPNDPFDAALIPIVETNRRKRKDYAADGDPFSNFRTTASMLGIKEFGPAESAFFNVLQKVARLQSLRMNGRMAETANESVIDTYLDLAVYGIILYAIVLQEQTQVANHDAD